MSDRITCPECRGLRGEQVGPRFLACGFCHGRGRVGGPFEPAERDDRPPPKKPPSWEHGGWRSPDIVQATKVKCLHCMDAREVVSLPGGSERAGGSRVMAVGPCPVCQTGDEPSTD
ncbi:hypothetical protein ACFQYP_41175 [Nonomuraea antimicrobica]|uniref:hypothetical protein n=1 Tax=Nonomuraea antimicrobica TaxID=561173 RepID=UPI0031EA8ABE